MTNKVLLKYIKKEENGYKFEQVENNNEEITLKIYNTKEFKDKIAIGEVGYAVFNENWINEWQKVQDPDKKLTDSCPPENKSKEKEVEKPQPIKKIESPLDWKARQTRENGIFIQACQMTIEEFKSSKDESIQIERVKQLCEELKAINTEVFK